jgi:hypothetical protein
MIKRILQFLFLLTVCISAHSQAVEYNAIATAYVTTTISQNVVFNSTMQQGGTFTFSVLAHNGGGRAGEHDTANVKIEFYTAGGSLVTSVNSNNSRNLLNPNAVCGNPCIDTSVPWSTLTISKTLTSSEAADVAYAKVSMYGVDGSFWAGDYGPWYRAPTFQQNGGSNLTYNPEFGPYNGVTAQGWTSSPGFGACQGAWGGSNACIVNSDGVPGSSTVGLVANANGGGPSATGGTTSGTAGGYNNTMTVTNAGTGATAGAPPAPVVTVTGTVITYTTRNVVSGNTTTVYRTPVTTTSYSDGTSTNSNGTETLYQTRVASTVVTNKIVGTTLTTYTTPINQVTTNGVTTIESNGAVVTTTQTVQQGLTYQVWRYDYKNYSCGIFGCIAIPFSYRTPSTNINDYGNTVRNGVTSGGMYLQTNARLPNGDGSLFTYNDGTVIRYTGTITAPVTTARPAGTVYRLYFYNQTDDGFVLRINGGTIINNSQTDQWQATGGNYNSNGWIDVVAGQSYNLEAWYWNVLGGVGHRFYWNYGDGIKMIPNSAFTTGVISAATIDTTGVIYSNSSVVNISGTTVLLGPTVEGGTITQNNATTDQVITSGSNGSAGITNSQQGRVNTWNNGSNQNANNYLYIDQISGDYNNITVTQTTSTGKNTIEATLSGTGNNVINATQIGTNYLKLDANGANNSITSQQSNNSSSSNFKETTITGNNNIISTNQKDNANKIMFTTVTGNSNSVTAVQEGTGNHYLENKLTGNGHTILVNQSGSTANNASIDLTNGGGAANIDLQQSGGKSFSIIQSCTNPAGCSTVIRQ